jgi:hypothetical protein
MVRHRIYRFQYGFAATLLRTASRLFRNCRAQTA